MREFILRARKGPSTPDFSLDDLPAAGHLEIVAHCITNALFYSLNIRDGVCLHLVFDGPAAPPKTVRIESDGIESLSGFDERSLCLMLQEALRAGRHLRLEEEIEALPGIFVAKRSFEALVRQKSEAGELYHLQRRAQDIRDTEFAAEPTFVFSDHLSMPKKTDKFLSRLGAQALSVGPKMLFASQCIALVHNELDRQGMD
jgi:tRNA (pseudouridine54-N1)-methyltransferase